MIRRCVRSIPIITLLLIVFYYQNVYAANNYVELSIPASNNAYFNNLEFPTTTIADPFILKNNDTYYIYSSGLVIMKSTDFKNWTMVTSRAIPMESEYNNYWAPEVYKYNNKFYMFYTGAFYSNNLSLQKRDILVAVSDSPEGPFVKKARINSRVNMPIDPNVLFDDDGKIYLYTKSEIGDKGTCCNGNGTGIYVEELNSDLLSVKSDFSPRKVVEYRYDNSYDGRNNREQNSYDVWNNWEQNFYEGSFIIKENGRYYIMYSTGNYNYNYAVGYAVSSNPISGFVKKTSNKTSPLLYGQTGGLSTRDSTKNIYSPGHNSVLKVSNDEMYTIYHSAKYNNGSFAERKMNADYMGIDSNGNLYINGPSKTNQPLPSGSMGLYKVSVNEYVVKSNQSTQIALNDNINYNVLNTSTFITKTPLTPCTTMTTSSINIEIPNSKFIEDIWLFGNDKGFGNKTANVIINNKYIMKNASLGTTGTAKIQIPILDEPVKNILINFSSNVVLSEVSLYYKKDVKIDIKGDVDGNSKVDTKDYILIRKHILSSPKLVGKELNRADVNSDGVINTKDYIMVRKIILNV